MINLNLPPAILPRRLPGRADRPQPRRRAGLRATPHLPHSVPIAPTSLLPTCNCSLTVPLALCPLSVSLFGIIVYYSPVSFDMMTGVFYSMDAFSLSLHIFIALSIFISLYYLHDVVCHLSLPLSAASSPLSLSRSRYLPGSPSPPPPGKHRHG